MVIHPGVIFSGNNEKSGTLFTFLPEIMQERDLCLPQTP
jgi:hypothetical protein